jgi:hypothetical protein
MCEALIALASELHGVWHPYLRRHLLTEIPENLSARLARRIVDGNLTASVIRQALEPTLRLRRRLGSVLSSGEETLEAVFEQHLILIRQDPRSLAHLGARAEIDSVASLASHADLAPQRLDLIPDGRSHVDGARSTPDALATYSEIPPHLQGMGRTERLEFTMVAPPIADGELASRIANALERKVRGHDGVSQLTTPLRVNGNLAPTWGSVIVTVPRAPDLSRAIIEHVHELMSTGSSGNLYEQFRAMQRFMVRQDDRWFSVSRTSPTEFTIDAL